MGEPAGPVASDRHALGGQGETWEVTLVVRRLAAGAEAEVRFARWGSAKVSETHSKDTGPEWEERWERAP